MANKCDAPIRRAEPVCQSERGGGSCADCDKEQQQHKQRCDDAGMLHGHRLLQQQHHRSQQHKQQQQQESHLSPPPPPRRMAPPNVKAAHARAQATAASARPLRGAKASPMPFTDEMDDDDSESMAQFRQRFDSGEFFLRQPTSDRTTQISRSA